MKNETIQSFFRTGALLMILSLILVGCKCKQQTLLDHQWVLEKFGPKDAPSDILPSSAMVPPASSNILLDFTIDYKFSGNDGCNNIFGEYNFGKYCRINLTNMKSTMMMCQPEIMDQASAIRDILENAYKYKVSPTYLKLYTTDGRILIYTESME